MTTITCPPADQLKAFYLGQLPDERSDELVAHVGVCSACQAELETVVDAEDSLIATLREPNTGSNLDLEPACEMGMLRALGALATVYEPVTDEISSNNENTPLPKTIGEYEILRALGRGGMGHVYLARHCKLGRLVALKILAGHRLGDRRASQRFEAEMRAIGHLSHPNIVTAHDAREIDGTAVLVTEYIDGFDLGQLLQRTGPLAVSDACEIVRQVALALQYTSDQGFVHRDVKPSNIMLSASGEVKLLDLGLARLQFGDVDSADVTGTGQTMGTADYISPEQVTDSRKVDVRSDIYSLGATLFKLLVGRAPFAEEKHNTAFAKMTAHVSTTPASVRSLRNDVPDELSRLVARMLAKCPEDRPQKPDAIAANLITFADGNNLELLARKAALSNPAQATPSSLTASIEIKTLTQSFWHRPIKLYVAIAAGLVGIMLGLCLGIIITITNPDGSKTVMKLAEGSKVDISEGTPAKDETPTQDAELVLGPILEFGLLIDGVGEAAKLAGDGSDIRVLTLAAGVEIANPLNREDGIKFALVSRDPRQSISASQIAGHVLDVKVTNVDQHSQIELTFDEALSKQMFELTNERIGRNLAIIAEGKIVAAPRINSPIGSKAAIKGAFTPQQLERIRSWLNSQTSPAGEINKVLPPKQLKAPLRQTLRDETLDIPDFGAKPSVPNVENDNDKAFRDALYAFALSLTEDRNAPITERNLEQLAAKLVPSAGTAQVKQVKDTLRKLWPFKGVTSILPGVPPEANWLLSGQETGYTILIDPPVMINGIKVIAECITAQPGVFDTYWSALKNDPQGPQIDGDEIFKHLGNQMILCIGKESRRDTLVAFSLTDPVGVQAALRNFNDSHDDIRVLKNYLVVGSKEHVDRLIAQVVESPELKAANNLKQIGIAFANFESSYRQLPASKNYREGGIGFNGPRAKHPFSWRVAILPFIEHSELYQQYDFNETWDSPKNLKMLKKMPAVYRSPFAPSDQKAGLTNYIGLAGIQCAMGEDVGVPLAQIKDGTSSTVLLVETIQTVLWTKPEDLPFKGNADAKLAQPFDRLELNCLMVDGTILSLKQPIDWERLGKLVTKDDGEPVTKRGASEDAP